MNDPHGDQQFAQQLNTTQILAAALIAGVAIAAVIFGLLAWNRPQEEGMVKYVGLLLLLLVAVPGMLVPSLVGVPAPAGPEPGRTAASAKHLMRTYQTRMIIHFALLEGAAFLNLVAFLVEHARWSLGVASLPLIAMIALFPTRTRVMHWLEAERLRSGTAT